MNPTKFYRKKAPKKRKDKEIRGKDWSTGKQIDQQRWATRKNGIKNQTLHQLHEANQLKKGGSKPNKTASNKSTKERGGKTPSLEEPSPVIKACLEMEVACVLYNAIYTLCL
jgi:hypothetical protein